MSKDKVDIELTLDRLVKNAAIFNPEKLKWIDAEHIKMKRYR